MTPPCGTPCLRSVVVGHTPPPKNGGGVQQSFLCIPADSIPSYLAGIRARWSTGGPLHLTSRCPTSTGAVHKSVIFRCVVFICRGHSGDIGVCLRRFCSSMSVVWDICLFWVGPGYDGLLEGVLFRSDIL